jgi:4-carboxymuconolactone decarboxylase
MARVPHQHYLKFKERHAGVVAAVESLRAVAQAAGPLDQKTLHLIQLAASAAIMSHGSTHSHTIRALEAGATPEEIHHAVIVLTSTIGFPKTAAALAWVDDVLERGY